MKPIELHPEARLELLHSIDWYNAEQDSLGY